MSRSEPVAFEALCDQAAAIDWVVHVKPPFGGPREMRGGEIAERFSKAVAEQAHG